MLTLTFGKRYNRSSRRGDDFGWGNLHFPDASRDGRGLPKVQRGVHTWPREGELDVRMVPSNRTSW